MNVSRADLQFPYDNTSPVAVYKSQPWHRGYVAAIFEEDREQMSERIRQAEQLIVRRERELWSGEPDFIEQHALNSARHSLRAIRRCMGLQRPDFVVVGRRLAH